MDKVLSARVDEATVQQIGVLANELKISRKAVIEAAIKLYSKQTAITRRVDPIENTCGVWSRPEKPQESVSQSRSAFNRSMQRHHQ